MRRILVEQARRKTSLKRGGGQRREPADLDALLAGGPAQEVLALHEALEQLAAHDPVKAKLVEMRFFAGLTNRAGGQVPGHLAEQQPTAPGGTPGPGCTPPWPGRIPEKNERLVCAFSLRCRIEGW